LQYPTVIKYTPSLNIVRIKTKHQLNIMSHTGTKKKRPLF